MSVRYIILLFFAVCLGLTSRAQVAIPQFEFPPVSEVADRLFNNYQIETELETAYVQFMKKPSGYYVGLSDYMTNAPLDTSYLYYSPLEKRYLDLPFASGKTADNIVETSNRVLTASQIGFQENLFYGYVGADKDVILTLELADELSARMHYWLGRAYSRAAMNMLNNQYGFSDPLQRFELPPGPNALAGDQLNQWLNLQNKAIEHFASLYELDPYHVSVVGSSYIQYSNEILTAYLQGLQYVDEVSAREWLRPDLYTDVLRRTAHYLLESCPPNAILFTMGDNDTYPLLYLQAKEGVRRDVSVVNFYLLAMPRYTDYLRRSEWHGAPLDFALSADFYAQEDFSYFRTQSTNGSMAGATLQQTLLAHAADFPTLLTSRIAIPVNEKNARASQTIPKGRTTESYTDSVFHSTGNGYLRDGEIAFLDILLQNDWRRPVCFPAYTSRSQLGELHDYLLMDGMVMHLLPLMPQQNRVSETTVDRLLKQYRFPGKDSILSEGEMTQRLLAEISLRTIREVPSLSAKKAKRIVQRFFEQFPDKRFPFQPYLLPLLRTEAELGLIKSATQHTRQLLRRLIAEERSLPPNTWAAFNELNDALLKQEELSQMLQQLK